MRTSAQGRVGIGGFAVGGRGGGALGGCHVNQPAEAALLRRPHPADLQHLLRRQHLALPQPGARHDDREEHGARQPGPLLVRRGPEAARRAAHLRQLPAAAAAAEGDAPGRASRSPTSRTSTRARSGTAAARRSRQHRGLLRAQELARQRRQPRRHRAARRSPTRGSASAATRSRRPASRARRRHHQQAYRTSSNNIEPILESSCAYGTCHSSPQADMYLTCGCRATIRTTRQLQLRAGGRLRDRPPADRR